jgi:hypothetical protein
MSRWALESNLLPSLLLITVYVLVCAIGKPKLLILAGFLAALCLYAYGTAYLFIPIFALIAYAYLIHFKKLKLAPSVIAAAVFTVTAVPIGLFVLANVFKTGTLHIGALTIPELSGSARFFMIINSDFLKRVTDLANFLIVQDDEMASNVIRGFGYVYLISMPLLILGLWPSTAADRLRGIPGIEPEVDNPEAPKHRGRIFKADFLMFIWLLIPLGMALFTYINVNRMNIVFFPMIYYIAKGIDRTALRVKWIKPALVAAFAIYFTLFCWTYFGRYRNDTAWFFNESLGSAIKYADSIPGKTIYVEHKYINMPYIHVLFNTEYPTPDFIATVQYSNPGDPFQEVSSFGRWRFGFDTARIPDPNAVYVLNNSDAADFDKTRFTDVPFRLYHVMVPK